MVALQRGNGGIEQAKVALDAARKRRGPAGNLPGELRVGDEGPGQGNGIGIAVEEGRFHGRGADESTHRYDRYGDRLFDSPGTGEIVIFRR